MIIFLCILILCALGVIIFFGIKMHKNISLIEYVIYKSDKGANNLAEAVKDHSSRMYIMEEKIKKLIDSDNNDIIDKIGDILDKVHITLEGLKNSININYDMINTAKCQIKRDIKELADDLEKIKAGISNIECEVSILKSMQSVDDKYDIEIADRLDEIEANILKKIADNSGSRWSQARIANVGMVEDSEDLDEIKEDIKEIKAKQQDLLDELNIGSNLLDGRLSSVATFREIEEVKTEISNLGHLGYTLNKILDRVNNPIPANGNVLAKIEELKSSITSSTACSFDISTKLNNIIDKVEDIHRTVMAKLTFWNPEDGIVMQDSNIDEIMQDLDTRLSELKDILLDNDINS
jgi:hypothetical protein